MPEPQSSLDLTFRSKAAARRAVRSEGFGENGAAAIYTALTKSFGELSFGSFLKRYLYRTAEMTEPFDSVPDETFQKMILEEFASRHVPAHFTPSSASLRKLSRNWLTQKTVSRQVVLLLGFGLGMSLQDVELFLTKGLLETSLSPKDPFEVICWYCYRFGLGFFTFSDLWHSYVSTPSEILRYRALDEKTARLRKHRAQIRDETSLMAYLSRFPGYSGPMKAQSVTAREHFDRLWAEAQQLYAEMISGQNAAIQKIRITAAAIESILYASVPRDKQGNLAPARSAKLNGVFSGKRLTRQRASDILSGQTAITRYDLMTLNYLVFSLRQDFLSPAARKDAFRQSTNRLLEECGMYPLYSANPYESFLELSISTEDPLCTFSDVFELCYADFSVQQEG